MAADDHVLIHTQHFGPQRIFLSELSFDWPPPEHIVMCDGHEDILRAANDDDDPKLVFERVRMSLLTDEQIAQCPNVARGAEYKYEVVDE